MELKCSVTAVSNRGNTVCTVYIPRVQTKCALMEHEYEYTLVDRPHEVICKEQLFDRGTQTIICEPAAVPVVGLWGC